MQLEVQTGRPKDLAGREEKEIAVYDFLDKLGISYERVDHEAAHTMEACAPIEEALQAKVCKNLLLTNSKHSFYYLLMMPGDKAVDTCPLRSLRRWRRSCIVRRVPLPCSDL